jgi:hypothetical protein
MVSGNKEFHKKKKGNSNWKIILILLFIVDVILSFWLSQYGSSGYGIELIQFSFLLLPIINLLHLSLLSRNDPLITDKNNFVLLKVSFTILIIANLMVGYNVYDQARDGIGLGFLGFYPLIFVVAINDLIALLFLQHYTTY